MALRSCDRCDGLLQKSGSSARQVRSFRAARRPNDRVMLERPTISASASPSVFRSRKHDVRVKLQWKDGGNIDGQFRDVMGGVMIAEEIATEFQYPPELVTISMR